MDEHVFPQLGALSPETSVVTPASANNPNQSDTAEDEKGATVYQIEEGQLEIDELNRHECMVC